VTVIVKGHTDEIVTDYAVEDWTKKIVIDKYFEGKIVNFDKKVTDFIQWPYTSKYVLGKDFFKLLSLILGYLAHFITHLTSIEFFLPLSFFYLSVNNKKTAVS
jgi:hypothetical protein